MHTCYEAFLLLHCVTLWYKCPACSVPLILPVSYSCPAYMASCVYMYDRLWTLSHLQCTQQLNCLINFLLIVRSGWHFSKRLISLEFHKCTLHRFHTKTLDGWSMIMIPQMCKWLFYPATCTVDHAIKYALIVIPSKWCMQYSIHQLQAVCFVEFIDNVIFKTFTASGNM